MKKRNRQKCKPREGMNLKVERAISSEERIRRAEEIYNRRKMQNGVRVATTSVNSLPHERYKLYKKLILQISICFVIYFIFYLIKNSNYIFSEEVVNKTKQFLSYDINFNNAYNKIVEYYNNNFKSYIDGINETTQTNIVNEEEQNLDGTANEEVKGNEQENSEQTGIGGGNAEELNIIEQTNTATEENTVAVAEEPKVELSQMEIDANEIKSNYSLILPLTGYTVTSRYGSRTATAVVSANHAGIDIGANEGTVFVAAMEGKVITATKGETYGNHILIENNDVITLYAHCKELYVKEGDMVTQGQKIGEVGSTGNATGPHLHFEIRKSRKNRKP